MKEIAILTALVLTTFYASFSEGAIRRVCSVELDNGTITKTYENCKRSK